MIFRPENVPRLYDLIRVEDRTVLPAFYFALQNTLVANDLDQGTRIAYGARRYRVVTLNGNIIESSGTMSGGGRTQIRGKMGTKVQTKTNNMSLNISTDSGKSLEELQIKAQELQESINYNQEEQGKLEKEITELQNNYKETEFELKRLVITIDRLESHLPHALVQLEEQKARKESVVTDSAKVKELEEIIAKQKNVLAKAEKAAAKIRDEVSAIKDEINSVHDDRVKPVQSEIKTISEQLSKLNTNKTKLQVEITNSERNIKKLETQVESLENEIEEMQNKIRKLAETRTEYDNTCIETQECIRKLEEIIAAAKNDSSGIHKEIQEIQKKENELDLQRVEIEQKLHAISGKISDVRSQIPHWQDKLKPLKLHDIPGDPDGPPAPLKVYTEVELASYTLQDIQYKESVQEELLKKKPNLSCIAEYIKKRDVYFERVKVLEEVTCKRNEMRQLYDNVRKKRYNEFMLGFHIIARKLKEMYQMITQGGDAELELVDSMDPFTEGVTFSVRPAKKTWKNICNLSGGEKTLSSLALVFALHYYKPSPLYFMDEIDAALDFKNISIVAHYIKQRTKNAQFIIISLRSNMFELSDYLVGIFKVKDCTGSVCVINEPPPVPPLDNPIIPSQEDIITPTNAEMTAPSSITENENSENSSQECPIPEQQQSLNQDTEVNENNVTANNQETLHSTPNAEITTISEI